MNEEFRYAIGVDLGGTFIKYGLVRMDGCLVYENKKATQANTNARTVIDNIIYSIKDVQQFAISQNIKPIGVGIGSPGIVDKTHRVLIGPASNINGWQDVMLADEVEKECNLPVVINNDANLMGLGEQAFGAARNFSDVLFLTIGTGIGGAIIIDNKLFGGCGNRGSELGHIPLIANGIACACGSIGCLEAYASTTALIKGFEKKCSDNGIEFPEEIDGKFIVQLFIENNKYAVESINEHCDYLGRGIAGMVNVFSPQRVVIGGGISEAGEFYIEKIRESVNKYVVSSCNVNTKISVAELGNNAGVLGAAKWAEFNFN
jgi:glucokinase